MADKIQIRRDTAANWTSANPILAQGEEGHELSTNKRKIGDGVTAWTSLPYIFTGVSNHAGLSGLGNDDHTQYLNETRHDSLPSDNPHSVTASQTGADTSNEVDVKIAAAITALTNGASSAADTLAELESLIGDNDTDITGLLTAIGNVQTQINLHEGNVANPHSVTKAQVGLGNVPNVNLQPAVNLNTAKVSADGPVSTHSDVNTAGAASGDLMEYNGTVWVPKKQRSSFICSSGRWYMNTNLRWVTSSDDVYGTNYYQIAEQAGGGSLPIFEWEHLGTLLPAGTILRKLGLICRANNNQVTDMQIVVVQRRTTAGLGSSTWQDSHMTNTVIFNGLWQSQLPSNEDMNDNRGTFINLNDFVMTHDSMISIYLKPVGSLSARRYIYGSTTLEVL